MKRKIYVAAIFAAASITLMIAGFGQGIAQTARQEAGVDEPTPISVATVNSEATRDSQPVVEAPVAIAQPVLEGPSEDPPVEPEPPVDQGSPPPPSPEPAPVSAQAPTGCWQNRVSTFEVKASSGNSVPAVYTGPSKTPTSQTYTLQADGSLVSADGLWTWRVDGGALSGSHPNPQGGITNETMSLCGSQASAPPARPQQPAAPPQPAPQPAPQPPVVQAPAPAPTPRPNPASVNQAWIGSWCGTWSGAGSIKAKWTFSTATATSVSGTYDAVNGDTGAVINSQLAVTYKVVNGTTIPEYPGGSGNSTYTQSFQMSSDGSSITATRKLPRDTLYVTATRC